MHREEQSNLYTCYIALLFIFTVYLLFVNEYNNSHLPKFITLYPNQELKAGIDEILQPDLVKNKNTVNNKTDEMVLLNTNSLKFHKQSCKWAEKCKHCIKISKRQAIEKGAVPCKTCFER